MRKSARGEVWLVQFRPGVGAEIQKMRPAVVLSPPWVGRLPLAVVVPITEWSSAFSNYSWFVPLSPSRSNGLLKPSGADAFQVKSVSEMRLIQKQGVIAPEELEEIAAAVAICVGYQL